MRFLYVDFLPPLTHPFSVTTATEVEDLVGGKRDFLNVANPTFDKKEDEGGGGGFFFFQPVAIFQQCSGDFQIITLAWRTASR